MGSQVYHSVKVQAGNAARIVWFTGAFTSFFCFLTWQCWLEPRAHVRQASALPVDWSQPLVVLLEEVVTLALQGT